MTAIDIHTHHSTQSGDLLIVNINIDAGGLHSLSPNRYYSCGIHPWYIKDKERQLQLLKEFLNHPNIVAIGEAGLDKLRGVSLDIQREAFIAQAILSEELRKPLIIHCVKAWDDLVAIKKELMPKEQWVIHGFRGNEQLARQLISHGFMLSFGREFNPKALQIAWQDSLLAETDEADINIYDVYSKLSEALGITIETFSAALERNVSKVFTLLPLPKEKEIKNK